MYPLVIVPSFAKQDFFDFSKLEAKQYLEWFLDSKKDRLVILQTEVQKNYPAWKIDFTKPSFHVLYEWFERQVSYRDTTQDEKDAAANQIAKTPQFINLIPVPNVTFSYETVSLCFDFGIYFGEALISGLPSLAWAQDLSSKAFIDYAQPLITKKGNKVPINPRRIAEGYARRSIEKINQKKPWQLLDELIVDLGKD